MMNFLVPVSFKHSVFIAVVQLNNREQSGPAKKKRKKKGFFEQMCPIFIDENCPRTHENSAVSNDEHMLTDALTQLTVITVR